MKSAINGYEENMGNDKPIIIKQRMRGQLFSLRYCAKMSEKVYNTLLKAIRRGDIPLPNYRSPLGHYLYTLEQVEVIVRAYRNVREEKIHRSQFALFIKANWPKADNIGPSIATLTLPSDQASDNHAGESEFRTAFGGR